MVFASQPPPQTEVAVIVRPPLETVKALLGQPPVEFVWASAGRARSAAHSRPSAVRNPRIRIPPTNWRCGRGLSSGPIRSRVFNWPRCGFGKVVRLADHLVARDGVRVDRSPRKTQHNLPDDFEGRICNTSASNFRKRYIIVRYTDHMLFHKLVYNSRRKLLSRRPHLIGWCRLYNRLQPFP